VPVKTGHDDGKGPAEIAAALNNETTTTVRAQTLSFRDEDRVEDQEALSPVLPEALDPGLKLVREMRTASSNTLVIPC
jgi:hypothetical protein